MPLVRQLAKSKKPERISHECVPVPGEKGRYYVKSRSAAQKGSEETYIVDVYEEEIYDGVRIVGCCPCKGFSVRKTCSHLTDAKAAEALLFVPALF